jgi:hypothetical protein
MPLSDTRLENAHAAAEAALVEARRRVRLNEEREWYGLRACADRRTLPVPTVDLVATER